MDIKIEANFHFSVSSIQYMPDGELRIALVQDDPHEGKKYLYHASLGDGTAEERPSISLLEYALEYARKSLSKDKTKDSYRLMCIHLEAYGDCCMDKVK